MSGVKGTNALTAGKMAKRICVRDDNIYDKRIIENILNMYMDECRKALLSGERVQITKVGTIIPEVKTRLFYNLPRCNKEDGNPPYTKLRIRRNNLLVEAMNNALAQNIENGIYGLEKLPFSRQQMDILKHSGYISEDAELPEDEIMEEVGSSEEGEE